MSARLVLAVSSIVLAAGLAVPAHAGHPEVVRARVVDVQPVYAYEEVPVEVPVCRYEPRSYGRGAVDPGASVLIGAVVGGALGNRIGDGRGQRLATLAGAGIGAAVGHELGRDARRRHAHGHRHPVRRCQVELRYEQREVLVGYDVAYRYDGRIRTTRLDHHPGRTIDIEVSVRPLG